MGRQTLGVMLAMHLIVGQCWMPGYVVLRDVRGDWPKARTWREVPEVQGGVALGIFARLVAWPYFLWRWMR